jgi:hypothetical protein
VISRRNRKKRKLNGFMVPVHFAVVVVLVSAIALGYLWLGCRCDSLGKDIKLLEARKAELEKKYQNEEYKWMRMKSPCSIEEALTKFGIAMTWPGKEQVVRLSDRECLGSDSPDRAQYVLKYASIGRNVLNE